MKSLTIEVSRHELESLKTVARDLLDELQRKTTDARIIIARLDQILDRHPRDEEPTIPGTPEAKHR